MIDILQVKGGQDLLNSIEELQDLGDQVYYSVQETFTATAGQTTFTLDKVPNTRPIALGVNGLDYYENVSFTANRASKTVTWTDASYTLEAGDVVSVTYYINSSELTGYGVEFRVQELASGNLKIIVDGTEYVLTTDSAAANLEAAIARKADASVLDNYALKSEIPGAATDSARGTVKLYSSTGNNADGAMTQSAVTTALSSKADTSDLPGGADNTTAGIVKLYNAVGSETDGAVTPGAVNTALSSKANSSDVPTKTSDLTNDSGFITSTSLPVNISELINDAGYISSVPTATDSVSGTVKLYTGTGSNTDGTISQSAITSALSAKANSADIPDVSSFITNTVNNLTNYYTKSEVYTQSEINTMISNIPKMSIEVVNALPTTDIDSETIYLVRNSSSSGTNLFTEYIYVNNAWEELGAQQLDLSGYTTTAALNAALADYTPTANLTTLLAAKADTADIPTNTSDLTNDSGFITNAGLIASSVTMTGFTTGNNTSVVSTSDSVSDAIAKLQNRIAALETQMANAVFVES